MSLSMWQKLIAPRTARAVPPARARGPAAVAVVSLKSSAPESCAPHTTVACRLTDMLLRALHSSRAIAEGAGPFRQLPPPGPRGLFSLLVGAPVVTGCLHEERLRCPRLLRVVRAEQPDLAVDLRFHQRARANAVQDDGGPRQDRHAGARRN